jgi:hypothetical protein
VAPRTPARDAACSQSGTALTRDRVGWRGSSSAGDPIELSEVVWENPRPDVGIMETAT